MASTSETPRPTERAKEYVSRDHLCVSKNNSKVQRVDINDPCNKRGYSFLGFCPDSVWTAKKSRAVFESLDYNGYNWYALLHDCDNGEPYLGR